MAIELDQISRDAAAEVARTIKAMNDQDAVLLQETPR